MLPYHYPERSAYLPHASWQKNPSHMSLLPVPFPDNSAHIRLPANHRSLPESGSAPQKIRQSPSCHKKHCCLLLPEVRDSNAFYGKTDFDGFFAEPIPILGVIGDSQGALYGQNCREKGLVKATYGTGSSVMMHAGDKPIVLDNGMVTSIAWGMDCLLYTSRCV